MNVTNRIMYHYHHHQGESLIIAPGQEFTIDDSFDSNMGQMVMNHSMRVLNTGKEVTALSIVRALLKDENYKKLDESDLYEFLRKTGFIFYREEIVIREIGLEQFREKYCPDKPSRMHSIWLSNKTGMNFWGKIFPERELYSLEVSGNLFKSSDEFLPDNGLSINDTLKAAERYWFPDFKSKHDPKKVEYLFQGRARVLTKIDRENK